MNYDKADLSDPLLKINFKNFGLPKPGFRPTEHPGIKKRRFDKIIPVMDAKKKTFKKFREGYMGPAVTPKNYEPKDTIIRTTDVKMKSAEKFRKGTGFNLPIPITKKKTAIKTV